MKNYISYLGLLGIAVLCFVDPAWASEAAESAAGGGDFPALASGLTIALAALGGTYGQSKAVSTALESIGRNPSAAGKMFVPMILGLVFLETLVIFSFVIALNLAGKA